MARRIGIIGFGNMGSAIAASIKDNYPVYCFDKDKNKIANTPCTGVFDSALNLVDGVDTVILSVKPQDFKNILGEIKASGHLADKLFISIAAGITTEYIQEFLGVVRVIRVMPNMAIKVGQGMSCLSKGKYATLDDFDFAQDLFEFMGEILEIEEKQMDAATAISGSGPGFFYYLSEAKQIGEMKKMADDFSLSLSEAAVTAGFSPRIASLLAETTVQGSLAYLEKTKLSCLEARQQIASRGGTTEAGLEVLQRGGSLTEAVSAAIKRAREISNLSKNFSTGE